MARQGRIGAVARRAGKRAPSAGAAAVEDFAPQRYIAKVSLETGQEIPGPIDPADLLVHAHRDNHPMDVAAQFVASRLIQLTGREAVVGKGLSLLNKFGVGMADAAGAALGNRELGARVKKLLGVAYRNYSFKFREPSHLSEREVKARVEKLQKDANAALAARGRNSRLNVLLTGATGFLGKELLSQVAGDRRVERVVAVVRPETIRDPKTKEVLRILSPKQRGALLLKRLHLSGARARKFEFIEGDIEKPGLGIASAELEPLRKSLTHVIHCAASVSFDDSYLNSYRANVLGCRNALSFSLSLQQAAGSPFVQHIAIETSYIHGRKKASMAQEGALVFPRHFYNNFYELTKAMASIETDRHMIEHGLRVAQLLPAIVIGHSRTGNNRGDTKVVNAPINAFGRSKEIIESLEHDPVGRIRARLMAAVANGFPGDPSAEINLVPVDRVVAGILAVLTRPAAIGARIHLATDNRIRSQDIVRITREELGVNVRLMDPTLYRNVTLPIMRAVLTRLNEPKLANALEKLATIFGSYSEWGQPVHETGNDVRILGLPIRRPDTEYAFRMLCRHNKYVQEFGKLRDADEIARRERIWEHAIDEIERASGHEVGAIAAGEFRHLIGQQFEPKSFHVESRGKRKGARA